MFTRLLSHETLIAIVLCAVIILVWIVTADTSPPWIYQGF